MSISLLFLINLFLKDNIFALTENHIIVLQVKERYEAENAEIFQAHNLCHISRQTTRKRGIWDIASIRRVYPSEEIRNPNLAWLQLCMPMQLSPFKICYHFDQSALFESYGLGFFDHLISCNSNLKVSRGRVSKNLKACNFSRTKLKVIWKKAETLADLQKFTGPINCIKIFISVTLSTISQNNSGSADCAAVGGKQTVNKVNGRTISLCSNWVRDQSVLLWSN